MSDITGDRLTAAEAILFRYGWAWVPPMRNHPGGYAQRLEQYLAEAKNVMREATGPHDVRVWSEQVEVLHRVGHNDSLVVFEGSPATAALALSDPNPARVMDAAIAEDHAREAAERHTGRIYP